MTVNDRIAVRKTLVQFDAYAHTGQPLQELYDEKKCHEAFSFTLTPPGREVKIIRIWGTGTIRVYFMYEKDKRIIILKTSPKRKDSLTSGEKLEIEGRAAEVIRCLEQHEFKTRIL